MTVIYFCCLLCYAGKFLIHSFGLEVDDHGSLKSSCSWHTPVPSFHSDTSSTAHFHSYYLVEDPVEGHSRLQSSYFYKKGDNLCIYPCSLNSLDILNHRAFYWRKEDPSCYQLKKREDTTCLFLHQSFNYSSLIYRQLSDLYYASPDFLVDKKLYDELLYYHQNLI